MQTTATSSLRVNEQGRTRKLPNFRIAFIAMLIGLSVPPTSLAICSSSSNGVFLPSIPTHSMDIRTPAR
ncbi:hypothetical protein [Paenibacillus chibensis]|nr:hypothetical protein [Paenibacillus chibensis]